MDQQALSERQFGQTAANYLASAVHAAGADIGRLEALVRERGAARALDLGCGAGHVSFALARGGAAHVTAYDPSRAMLDVVAREAASRGAHAITVRSGAAESLPFGDASFELVVSRFSAHHWSDVPRAMRECARVLAPGGRLVIIDVVAPEAPLLDTCLQTIEFLRDGSHVRNYRISEWRSMLLDSRFAAPASDQWKLPLEFSSWVARIGTPPERVAALRAVFAALPGEARGYFAVAGDGSFTSDCAWIETVRAA